LEGSIEINAVLLSQSLLEGRYLLIDEEYRGILLFDVSPVFRHL